MKTYSPNEFFNDFLQISEKLTMAELRMLYLLIIQPNSIELSQQEFAFKINTHRRTIYLGLKKLRECRFINDVEENSLVMCKESIQGIPPKDIAQAIEFIIRKVVDFYQLKNQPQIVHEDFYNIIIGNKALNKNLRYNKEFITEVIKNNFPRFRFYFLLSKSDFNSEKDYHIIFYLNNEIMRLRSEKQYLLKKETFMEYLDLNYDISEKYATRVIRSNFHHILIKSGLIIIQKTLKDSLLKRK